MMVAPRFSFSFFTAHPAEPFKTFAIIDTSHRRSFAVEALYERSAV
jgi:hypothetical protein